MGIGCCVKKNDQNKPLGGMSPGSTGEAQTPIKGSEFQQKYRLMETIRSSAFTTLKKATFLPTGQFRFVKLIHKSAFKPSDPQPRLSEAAILRSLDHPNIARLLDAFEDESYVILCSEFVSGSSLLEFIAMKGRITEANAAEVMSQVFAAVSYCHEKRIVHRDLRPENIQVMEGNDQWMIKITDFGCAGLIDARRQLVGLFGSTYFLAPEVLRGSYTEKCDLWSCGVLLYLMLAGKYPYEGMSEKQIMQDMISGRVEIRLGEEGSGEVKQLLARLLRKDPKERISASEALHHPWVQSRLHHLDLSPVIGRLKAFSASNQLRDALLSFISTRVVSEKETEELRAAFIGMDKNGDGFLSPSELREAYHYSLSEPELREVLSSLDINHDGRISYSEFLRAALDNRKHLSRRNLEITFRSIDLDNNGVITLSELKSVLDGRGFSCSQEWQHLLRDADKNGDGVLDLREFTEMLIAQA